MQPGQQLYVVQTTTYVVQTTTYIDQSTKLAHAHGVATPPRVRR